jgi:sulfonate transport system substrate-binding protein
LRKVFGSSMHTRTALSFIVCALTAACSRSPAADGRTATPGESPRPAAAGDISVRIGYQKSGSPFLLKSKDAQLQERLRKQGAGLEWLEFQHGPALLEAMRAGAVDVGYVGETPPVFAQAGGVPFVYVATDPPSPRSEAILVPASSPIRELSQLRGKKIALNRGSNVHYLALRALESAGLAFSDVELLFLAPADARTAFDSGKIDAWVIWDPFFAAAELAGARVLKDGEGLVDNHQFYVARKDFAGANAPLVKIVLDAFAELSDWAAHNPEEAARLTAAASGVGYEALLAAERRHTYGLRPITPEILSKQQTIADAFLKLQVVPAAIDTSSAYLAKAGFIARQ